MKLHFSLTVIFILILISIKQVSAEETIKHKTYFQHVVKTAKERLGKKFADNQRINNCKVPIAKRGDKPRPDQCHQAKH